MWLVDKQLAFSAPWVKQVRNAHNYLADYEAETPLYSRSGALVRFLRAWRPPSNATSLGACLEELIIALYEIGVVEETDVLLHQAWLDDLENHGRYALPRISRSEEW
mmetsp:Transcript_2095/g.6272  ORF Transcript_2095/g.6272 Transcript_2095/m.6272 type:complete len:107 (+) Transcript_2095:3-323(+)